MVCAPGMEQPANQPSLLSLTADTVGHTTLKSSGFPSGPASSVTFWMTSSDGQTLRFLHEQVILRTRNMRHATQVHVRCTVKILSNKFQDSDGNLLELLERHESSCSLVTWPSW